VPTPDLQSCSEVKPKCRLTSASNDFSYLSTIWYNLELEMLFPSVISYHLWIALRSRFLSEEYIATACFFPYNGAIINSFVYHTRFLLVQIRLKLKWRGASLDSMSEKYLNFDIDHNFNRIIPQNRLYRLLKPILYKTRTIVCVRLRERHCLQFGWLNKDGMRLASSDLK
jgi:hypothetical protein